MRVSEKFIKWIKILKQQLSLKLYHHHHYITVNITIIIIIIMKNRFVK